MDYDNSEVETITVNIYVDNDVTGKNTEKEAADFTQKQSKYLERPQ